MNDVNFTPINEARQVKCYVYDSKGFIIYDNPINKTPKMIYANRKMCKERF